MQLLTDVLVEQIRRDDLVPLRLLLMGAPARVMAEAQADGGDVDSLLDRLVSMAGLFAMLDRHDQVERVVDALSRIYDDLIVGPHAQERRDLGISPDNLRFRIVTRVYALGGVLVRLGAWREIRYVAAVPPRGVAHDNYWGNWLVHGDVMAARAGIHNEPDGGDRYRSTLLYAQEHVARLPALRMDVRADDERVLTSLCEFSLLACLVAVDTAPPINPGPFLAQFAIYPSSRTDRMASRIVTDPQVREGIFARGDADLAAALRLIASEATGMRRGYFDGWTGFTSPEAISLLEAHRPQEPAP